MFSCEYVDGKRMLFHQGNSIRFPEMFYIHFRKQDNYYELRYPGINTPYRKFSKGEDLFKNYLKLVEEITENESIYDIGIKTFLLARQYELDGVKLPYFVRTKTYNGEHKALMFRDPIAKTYTLRMIDSDKLEESSAYRQMVNLSACAMRKIKDKYISLEDIKNSMN